MDDNPWGWIIEWSGPEPEPPAPVGPFEERPARDLLRAWWRWERWCVTLPEVRYPSRIEGERPTGAFEDALVVFAAWAGQPANEVRERMASARRAAVPAPGPYVFDERIPYRARPFDYQYALAAAIGHT